MNCWAEEGHGFKSWSALFLHKVCTMTSIHTYKIWLHYYRWWKFTTAILKWTQCLSCCFAIPSSNPQDFGVRDVEHGKGKWGGGEKKNKANVSVSLWLIVLLLSSSLSLWDKARNCCAHKPTPLSEQNAFVLLHSAVIWKLKAAVGECHAFRRTPEVQRPRGCRYRSTKCLACHF